MLKVYKVTWDSTQGRYDYKYFRHVAVVIAYSAEQALNYIGNVRDAEAEELTGLAPRYVADGDGVVFEEITEKK